ncbi:MAG: RNase adapter RapZ [Ruminococcaceae bacterium]|nr:RNase adapter RapZ [Oscillospiraceae bacterium]
MDFMILTGMSGAGKSRAADTLEDMGYLCIDNMPVAFIPKFAEMYSRSSNESKKVAFVIDVRGEIEFDTLIKELDALKERGYSCTTLFVDCDSEVIINRYKETRRIHPLVPIKNLGMKDAIELERKMLKPIKKYSDYVIDTTHLSVRQLRDKIFAINSNGNKKELMLTCMSFGFKHGIVTDADLVFDVRCFPNPFYITELKDKTGLEQDVKDYVFSNGEVTTFLEKLYDMLNYLIPLYAKEGKSQLTIAIGCTGGKHRSVAITEEVGKYLSSSFKTVIVHRDIAKLYDSIKQEY